MSESVAPIRKTISRGYSSLPGRRLRIEKSVAVNLFLLAVPFYGILINGYQYGIQDHDLQLPEIIRLADPSYFPNDYFFSDPSAEYTFWVPIMAFMARRCALDTVCLIGYLASHYLLYWAVYHISLNLFRSRSAALLALFLLLVQRQVGGTSMDTREIFFGVRTSSIAFALLAMLFLITDRIRPAAFFSGVLFLLHPLIAVPVVTALSARLAGLAVLRDLKSFLQGLSVLALTTMPLLYKVFFGQTADVSDLNVMTLVEPAHLNILQHRCSYFFISNWPLISVLSGASYVAVLGGILIGRLRMKRLRRSEVRICEILATSLCLFAVGFVFGDRLPNGLIVQMQLGRCLYPIVYLATIYCAYVLLRWAMAICRAGSRSPVSEPSKAGRGNALNMILGALAVGVLIGMHLTVSVHAAANLLVLVVFVGLVRKKGGAISRVGVFLLVEFALLGIMLYVTFLDGTRLVSSLEGYFIWIHDTWLMLGAVAGSLLYGVLSLDFFQKTGHWRSRCAYGTTLVANAGLLSVVVFTIPQVYLPPTRPQNPLTDVAYWCKRYTPRDALIMLDPQARHFRIYSNRAIVASAKDGGKAAFSKQFAYEWLSRMEQLWDYENISEERFLELSARYGASHIVTPAELQLSLPLVYRNDWLNLYQVALGPPQADGGLVGGRGRTIADFDAETRRDPNNAVAYQDRGSEYFSRGEYDRAIADFTEAVRLDPKLATAYNNRGFVYQNMQQPEKALADYSLAIGLDPAAVMARGNRGTIYTAMGEYQKAVEDFSKLIELDPNGIPAYCFRAVAQQKLGHYDKAVADLSEAIRLDPTSPQPYLDRAAAYRALGDPAKAEADESKAQALGRLEMER